MSTLVDATRPFWIPSLNQVAGQTIKGVGGWICDEDYQIYSRVESDAFVLSVTDMSSVVRCVASDINRIAIASFETLNSVAKPELFPKSIAWLVIKTYYSAFFAAHALLRIFGVVCEPLEKEQINSITKVASLYGNAPATPVKGGLYKMEINTSTKTLMGSRIKSMNAGPHESFWMMFHDLTTRLSTDVLAVKTATVQDRQSVSVKLTELAANLCFASSARGRWLSVVRNAVNYNQRLSTWFPYTAQKAYYSQLFDKAVEWKADPMDVDLLAHEGKDLRRFQATCSVIIGLLRETVADMAVRCTTGKSFHTFGSLAFLNLLQQRAKAATS